MKKTPVIFIWMPPMPSESQYKLLNRYVEKIRDRNDVKLVITSRNKSARKMGEDILFGRGFKVLESKWLDEIFGFERIYNDKSKITNYFDGRIFPDIELQDSVLDRINNIDKLIRKALGLQGSIVCISHKGLVTMYLWKKVGAIVDPVEFYMNTDDVGGFILPEFPYLQGSERY